MFCMCNVFYFLDNSPFENTTSTVLFYSSFGKDFSTNTIKNSLNLLAVFTCWFNLLTTSFRFFISIFYLPYKKIQIVKSFATYLVKTKIPQLPTEKLRFSDRKLLPDWSINVLWATTGQSAATSARHYKWCNFAECSAVRFRVSSGYWLTG